MKSQFKKILALVACLCLVLPIAFHSIPDAGSVFLPMHIPVLICGMICGWPYGLACGLIGPFLSHLTFQMPPAAMRFSSTASVIYSGWRSMSHTSRYIPPW